jgi:hypothetical protein
MLVLYTVVYLHLNNKSSHEITGTPTSYRISVWLQYNQIISSSNSTKNTDLTRQKMASRVLNYTVRIIYKYTRNQRSTEQTKAFQKLKKNIVGYVTKIEPSESPDAPTLRRSTLLETTPASTANVKMRGP